ncbi:hypothetical protein C3E97_015870 [Pseudomonas sp. MWU12-2115]|nr:hypothetical protein C3E97_015870 [Pseudomonas sp. MWU12-2115]
MGASLLAKRSSQSTMMLNDQPLSRAGSLPQVQQCFQRSPRPSISAWFCSGVPIEIRRNWAIRSCLK